MKNLGKKNNSNKKLLIGGAVLVSIPMLAMAGSLTIPGVPNASNCQYNSFDVNANGELTVNLVSASCLGGSTSSGGSSTGGSSTGGSSTGGSSTGGSSSGATAVDANALNKFNTDYAAYNNKDALGPQTLTSGKTVYIVNQGGGDTSIPSCMKGKKVLQNCAPTGWSMGVKANEIYALRLKTKSSYSYGGIRIRQNTFSGGQTIQANYKYTISSVPGASGTSSFQGGKCVFQDVNSSSTAYLSPSNSGSSFCTVPANTVFYLNVELTSADVNKCASGTCTNYIMLNGLAVPTGINQ